MKEYLRQIFSGSRDAFFREADQALRDGKKRFIVTANPEILMKAENSPEIREILFTEDTVIVPDGISVVKAMRKCGIPAQERITGVELAGHLLDTAGAENKSVFLLGAKEDVVQTLVKKMKRKYPKMAIRHHNGYDGDKDDIFEDIKQMKPDLVLVALGVPAQEMLIYRHIGDFDKGIFIGVGGSFDVLSGMKKRAPQFFIKTNTEWLYRIAKEPSRLKRFYESNVQFMRQISKKG